MRPHRDILRFATVLLACILCACSKEGLSPGSMAPEFKLTNTRGEEVSLSAYRGKVVLLNFWASFCAPCLDEMPDLQRSYLQLRDQGFVVVAVAVRDQIAKVEEVQRRFSVTFPVLMDVDGKVEDLYKVQGFPESFIIDREGKLVLFPDPEARNLVLKVVGPRGWARGATLDALRGLL